MQQGHLTSAPSRAVLRLRDKLVTRGRKGQAQAPLPASTAFRGHPSLCSPKNRRDIVVCAAAADDDDDDFDLDALLADLEAPVLEGEPRYYQEAAGGEFEGGIAVSFGNDDAALDALENSAVVVDRSHWGRIRVSGPDRISFMHNQSTADIMRLQPGQGTETVMVTAQARTVDLATALVQGNGIMLIVSPGQAEALVERLNKYIFPLDKVEVTDISSRCGMLTVAGPGSDELLEQLNGDAIIGKPEGSHTLLNFGGSPVIVVAGTGLRHHGYTFIVDESATGELWRQLAMTAIPMGETMWEKVRVLQGRPAPGAELTDDYNPLEAGLFHAVSLAKGCYIGQETIAKVHNLSAIKQELWGLKMAASCSPGDKVTSYSSDEASEEKPLGVVTSVTSAPNGQGFVAMAYLRCKNKGEKVDLEGTKVLVEGRKTATVVAPPYLSRAFAPADLPQAKKEDESKETQAKSEADLDAEAAAKAAKMKAMQDRLAAYQAQMAAAKKSGEGSTE